MKKASSAACSGNGLRYNRKNAIKPKLQVIITAPVIARGQVDGMWGKFVLSGGIKCPVLCEYLRSLKSVSVKGS